MPFFAHLQAALAIVGIHVVRKARFYSAVVVLGVFVVLYCLFIPPITFPRGIEITVRSATTTGTTAVILEEAGVIHSVSVFKLVTRLFGADTALQSGTYRFEKPIGLVELVLRLMRGETGIPEMQLTFPEGYTVREMAETLHETIPGFDIERFKNEAKQYEGYLFPDTYAVSSETTPEELINMLRTTFAKKTKTLPQSEHSFKDVVIMASLLEKEARTTEERRIIAGILWDRLELGMPLQVDAVFGYIRDTDTYHPDADDLALDSPYNTYRYRGLPPTPIGNPGLDALSAALSPVATPYLYYLTGDDGITYYAETFEEHKQNKAKYLK